ncbi:MAG: hypothetical protein CM1200mP20_03700 [Pseudomonadota bacterium]|nr:MAG: hypothetical protein CM1200mP20_03700 [Pseudomonadota bacterium]
MSKTQAFFNDYLPGKLSVNPDLAGKVDQIFQFEIEGAGSFSVDLTVGEGSVLPERMTALTAQSAVRRRYSSSFLDDPTSAMTLMSAGQLTVSNLMAAMSLQKIF